ncbi:coiled-coil domain-containing protein 96-like [Pollicipes pollicipes]|uniref:coiled-coil domain-containing protein 96-like n=1 Tax=Pollicipes pollicipes TaxID=41117 RepID=UPI0018855055|nr:coiled-coil domain-containing protein 96-like [Pollicipes pollicipes]
MEQPKEQATIDEQPGGFQEIEDIDKPAEDSQEAGYTLEHITEEAAAVAIPEAPAKNPETPAESSQAQDKSKDVPDTNPEVPAESPETPTNEDEEASKPSNKVEETAADVANGGQKATCGSQPVPPETQEVDKEEEPAGEDSPESDLKGNARETSQVGEAKVRSAVPEGTGDTETLGSQLQTDEKTGEQTEGATEGKVTAEEAESAQNATEAGSAGGGGEAREQEGDVPKDADAERQIGGAKEEGTEIFSEGQFPEGENQEQATGEIEDKTVQNAAELSDAQEPDEQTEAVDGGKLQERVTLPVGEEKTRTQGDEVTGGEKIDQLAESAPEGEKVHPSTESGKPTSETSAGEEETEQQTATSQESVVSGEQTTVTQGSRESTTEETMGEETAGEETPSRETSSVREGSEETAGKERTGRETSSVKEGSENLTSREMSGVDTGSEETTGEETTKGHDDGESDLTRLVERTNLEQQHHSLLMQRRQLLTYNQRIQQRLSEHFSHKTEDTERVEKNVGELEQRYTRYLHGIREQQRVLADEKQRQLEELVEFHAQVDEEMAIVAAEYEAVTELRRQVALNARSSRTGRLMRADEVEALISREQAKELEVHDARLESLRRETRLGHLEQTLRDSEELAGGIHLIDFEQLKIENQTYAEKIEERNEDLTKLRRKISNTVQILTHLKERIQFEEAENQRRKNTLETVSAEVTHGREGLARLKQRRDHVRNRTAGQRASAGLLGHEALLRDFESRVDEEARLVKELQLLKREYGENQRQSEAIRQMEQNKKQERRRSSAPAARPSMERGGPARWTGTTMDY